MKLQFDSSFIQTTFSILLLVLCTAAYSNAFLGNETDYKALLAIKSKLNDDDGGVLMSWNDSLHHCSWEGVTCGPKHNRVIKLILSARGLGGTISPFIGNMTFLTYIGLSNNSLSGPIPPEIGRLWRLQGLYLFNNILSGEIPGSISGCVNLQNLSLAINHLHGELPMGLGRLSNLKYLWIESNYKLSGPIFKVITNLTSLVYIEALNNSFKGTISPFIGNMSFLAYIGLNNNGLSGPIPPEIGRLSRLQGLYLYNNSLSGEIPSNISGCINLQNLSLSYNHLEGELPMGLGTLSNLKYLWIDSNYKLTGSIFKVIANLTSLEAIQAFNNSFKGTISPFIGNLTFLTYIGLSNNGLSGPIPPEIGRLWRLQGLYLYNNSLSGEISSNISGCINLQNLSLSYNHLQGEVPMGLGRLSNLKNLLINSNYKLVGPLFKVIANLTSLELIYAYENAFTGNIPDSISRMTNLTWLALHSNKLSGTIPPSIFNLSSLQALDLGDNQLRGSIPPFISSFTLPQLQILSLFENYLSGPLPTSIQNLTTLQYIELFTNKFTGSVSINFGHLNSLQWLSLYSNKFEGDINFIITTLLNCTNLKMLHLEDNYFTGILPKHTSNLSTTLTGLSFGGDSISGQIPIGISNLMNLRYLEIAKSQLTGNIPRELGKLQKLEQLYLYSNKLIGEIPYSFGNLSRLSILSLFGNHLQGRIPPSLGNCSNLIYLYLYNNNFSGLLPKQLFGGSAKFIIILLSLNQLQGSLPIEITGQIQLTFFDIYGNKLSGEFPQGLGNLLDLQNLSMGVNFFHGPIPPSLASLKSLAYFDISQNNMSGHLPQYFSTFPYLLYLNLSYNNFEGEVPSKGVYANSSAIFLDGNKRLCGGILQLHLPRCVEKGRMSRALMLAISITSAIFGVLTIATCIWLYLQSRKRRRKSLVSHSLVKKPFLKVSYDMLLKATNGFSPENLLGSGAFGSVYKGVLDGITIAVKVLNLHYRGGSKSFTRECEVLRKICHRNLVGIITICSSIDFQGNEFKALVFEFMPNGNLESWLHQDGNLSLLQRVDIAIDVAHALNYIHHECENPIAHCDLKPSNVLLDHDMVAHVADFGLAKVLAQPLHPNQSSSIGARGTIGYVAPEYGMGSEVSLEADLYSFGILLLELMTRKRPTDEMFNEDLNLHMYAKAALPDQVLQIVDSSVLIDEDSDNEEVDSRVPRLEERLQQREKCISFVIRIGVACSRELPSDRMKMSEAISELQKARNIIDYSRHRHNLPRGA